MALKLFSIRVKNLFVPIVLRKIGNGLLLFQKNIFLKYLTLDDFTIKNAKYGRGICIN